MPLSPVSPNVQESEEAPYRRARDHHANITLSDAPSDENYFSEKSLLSKMSASALERQHQSSLMPEVAINSPPESSPPADTEAGRDTPTRNSPSPNATPSETPPLAQSSAPTMPATTNPLPKATQTKRKLAPDEKAKEQAEKRQKQEAKAAEKAEKEAAKAAKQADKDAADAEKAKKKAEKAAEKEARDAAKARIEAEKKAEKEALEAKQQKQKNMMASFLKKAPSTPVKRIDQPQIKTEVDSTIASLHKPIPEPIKSAYEQAFQPFFIKAGVSLAPPPFEMDDDTKEAKSKRLDEYLSGVRGEYTPAQPFDAQEVFDFAFPQPRGIMTPSVKEIMATIYGDDYSVASGRRGSKGESQTEKNLIKAQDKLDAIPMKYLRFYEDVRPAYCGTMTTLMNRQKLRLLSRRPTGKILPLAYDYDSEAEWVEDDGEDLDDAEDEEEDVDADEEMDDFVDDSELAPSMVRPGFEADSQPISTGVCFENPKRLGPCATTYKFRLEFLLDTLEHHSLIDPFSTAYWPRPEKKATAAGPAAPTKGMMKSAVPAYALKEVACPNLRGSATLDGTMVRPAIIDDFKRALISEEFRDLTKTTIVELLAKKFTSCTKLQVKTTVDAIAHRVATPGAKKSAKHWALLPGHELKDD
ncbi:hypothetical protein GGR57DRAFT_460302 [Xylariaceae sp. FL1272]|nr:hypothetical protein GGR57DRAFT_460302 [Xylariaceae sp. FL1272]